MLAKVRRCKTCGYLERSGADMCPNCNELVDGQRRALGKGLDTLLPSVLPALDQANRAEFEHGRKMHVRIEGLVRMQKLLAAAQLEPCSPVEGVLIGICEDLIQWQLTDLRGQG